ncbi:MAG TPA: ABC transporter permease [Chthoniobacterales bacterium]|nr:ABC transporter permease [Chthoniobacterales bacterium]
MHVFYPEAAKARGAHLLRVYARLQPGLTMTAAQNELQVIDQHLAQAYPDENKQRNSRLLSLHERTVGDIRPALLIPFGAVGLLLLIACANFANLLLVRVAARRQELTIRAALGAARWRLIGQVLTESVLLAILGGAAGLLLGSWGVDALLALKPENLPRVESISLDAPVLAFTFALSLVTGIVFGFLPAWQATRVDVNGIVPSGMRSVTAVRSRLGSILVVAELSLALVLLIGAGLLGQAFWRLTSVAPGFDPEGVLTMRVELPEARYKEIARQTQFREAVLENMNRVPGVEAAMISEIPLGGDAINHNFIIEGRPPMRVGEEPELYNRSVAGVYFKVLGIPVLQGRALSREDRADSPAVGVINESMARQYFRDENPVGRRIRWARNEAVEWITIVGVVGNVRHFGLAHPDEPAIYTPYAQSDQAWKRWSEIVVRTPRGPEQSAMVAQLKGMVWKVDPLLPITRVRSMAEVMAVSLAERSFNAVLLGVFAAVALLLASVGLYGVLAYSVSQRTREIGIRMALGAQAGDVLGMVLRQGLALTLLGVGVGVAVSLASTRILAGFLYGVTPTDAGTFAGLAFLLIAVSLAACFVPARRAMKVDPMVALRYD